MFAKNMKNLSDDLEELKNQLSSIEYSMNMFNYDLDREKWIEREKVWKIIQDKISELEKGEVYITKDENGNKIENIRFFTKTMEVLRELREKIEKCN